jgi:hypothetical protein
MHALIVFDITKMDQSPIDNNRGSLPFCQAKTWPGNLLFLNLRHPRLEFIYGDIMDIDSLRPG